MAINTADQAKLWTRQGILEVENRILRQIVAARTPEAVEAAISYARFLLLSGLYYYNYPLFLNMM